MKYPERTGIRLKEYNYGQDGAYFITVCVKDRRRILCDIVGTSVPDCPKIQLYKYGEIFAAVRSDSTTVYPARETLKIYTTRSKDNGKTWETPQLLDLCGAPPHLLEHSSGALILAYSRRKAPMGEYVRVSYDGGVTWSKDTRIGTEPIDWDHGYPTSVELANGDILTTYYQKCPGDEFNSIHSVRWNLEEIK